MVNSNFITGSGTSGRVGVTCFITYDIMGMIKISWEMKKEKKRRNEPLFKYLNLVSSEIGSKLQVQKRKQNSTSIKFTLIN